jgi:FkbH-like protein
MRKESEESFTGTNEAFLRTLDLSLTIARAQPDDIERAYDLTVRTHQLNATGYTYSREELTVFCASPSHRLYVASLTDRFGTYGRIGLALLETDPRVWRMKLLLMSCRTMSRGVGGVFLRELLDLARRADVRFVGEFVPTDRNRLMYVTYRFAGFREIPGSKDPIRLEHDLVSIAERPAHYRVAVEP